ncbi:MAG: transglycosylase domain-containing protein [Microthrixaceae bacterium]|jgi:penicillin-binding protein 1A|nr:transglycosylase domain-containing protein [Microthrixaceae bacterium]
MRKRTRKPVPVHNLKVTRKGKVKKRGIIWRWRRVFCALALVATFGLAGVVFVLTQIELPRDPRFEDEYKQTSFMCSAEVQVNCNAQNAMAQLHGTEDRVLVTYEQIPEVLKQAVIATEDKDFFEHDGVDPLGIARAAYHDIRGTSASRQGGSTITQQYVKKTYLTAEQTVTRKIKEAVMAIKLEQKLSKEEILTRYLNTVYFGRGAYGVQAASRAWFGHDVEAVTAGEAAFLAGLLRNPNGADPYRGPDSLAEAERRRLVSLQAMVRDGYLTESEKAAFAAVPMDPDAPGVAVEDRFIQPPPVPSTLGEDVKGAEWGSEYFAEYVRQWLIDEFGADAVYGGGLKVYTTLDQSMQKSAFEAVTSVLDRDGDPSGALVALDDRGQVRAMMAGTDFADQELNLATGRESGGSGRPPGSTFKTFALAEAVREGYSIRSVLPSPTNLEISEPQCTNGGDVWKVRGGPGGGSSLVTATKKSINTTYAELMVRLGPDAVADLAQSMGVSSLADQKVQCSWVLGSGEVSVMDMAAAYSTLANEGTARTPIVVTRVEFPDGTVRNYEAEETQVLTPEQAARVTFALQQVIQGGTGREANFGRPAAGKTGTTQNNADGWFVGYTPDLTAAVWMGFPEGQIPMRNVHGMSVQGGNFPARIWNRFMTSATANMEPAEFREWDDDVLGDGETLDPNLGKTSVIGSGSDQNSPNQAPRTTVPGGGTTSTTSGSGSTTTSPATTAPATTAPPATTSPPATTAPAGGGADP